MARHTPYDRGMDLRTASTPDELRGDLRRRLAQACAHFTPAEFEALVERIVRTELKYRPDYEADLAVDGVTGG